MKSTKINFLKIPNIIKYYKIYQRVCLNRGD